MVVRFDDVCLNTDMKSILAHSEAYRKLGAEVWWAVSPLCVPLPDERVYPKEWNPLSDWRVHYRMTRLGLPEIPSWVVPCSHGLVHADHRLMSRDAQELSIVTSCTLLGAWRFVPPYNHYNDDTESVCAEFGLTLIRYEDGWKSIEHNEFDPSWKLWYAHHRNLPPCE